MNKRKTAAVLAIAALVALAFAACPSPTGGRGPNNNNGPSIPSNPAEAKAMVQIPGGTFMMGSPESEPERYSDETQHSVSVSSFWMGKYEVTQGQYESVMGSNPSYFKTADGDDPTKRPVECVSWYDAIVFCNKLSMMEGLTPAYSISGSTDPAAWGSVPTWSSGNRAAWDAVQVVPNSTGYRLPTEAQWEYACRGNYTNKATETATKPFGVGDGTRITGAMANFDGEYAYKLPGGEYEDPSGAYLDRTAVVGSYAANNYGLYDMHGNVWEWCWDWYSSSYYTSAGASGPDPAGPVSGSNRV